MDLHAASLVTVEPLSRERAIPVVLRPVADGVKLAAWSQANRELVDRLLLEHKALLFRGFRIQSAAELGGIARSISGTELLQYRDRSTPRREVGPNVYVSTVYPADQRIDLHNEGTYWQQWALQIYFCCLKAPAAGGQTPIADVARVCARIDPTIRARFEERGVMYVRNYSEQFGLPWPEVFQVETRAEVDAYCRANDIGCEWLAGDRLRTRQVRPAVRVHPRTGQPVWFNHAAFFHISSRLPDVRRMLLEEFAEEDLPFNTYYGSGAPIEPEVVAHLRAAYHEEKVVFDWRNGDVMLLDNMTVAHAREPYAGDREVIVAMTSPYAGSAS